MKPRKISVEHLVPLLKRNHIALAYDADFFTNGNRGWLSTHAHITLSTRVEIERYVGIYAGPYRPSVGGRKGSGLCSMGAFSFSRSPLPEQTSVGRYCSLGEGIKILDSDHPSSWVSTSVLFFRPNHPVFRHAFPDGDMGSHAERIDVMLGRTYPKIGHDVWIGQNAVLRSGIEIGTGAIVAANTVVTKDVPPYAIVAGNPGVIRKYRFDEDTIERLLKSEWWRYAPWRMAPRAYKDVERFLDDFAAQRDGGSLEAFAPLPLVIDPRDHALWFQE